MLKDFPVFDLFFYRFLKILRKNRQEASLGEVSSIVKIQTKALSVEEILYPNPRVIYYSKTGIVIPYGQFQE